MAAKTPRTYTLDELKAKCQRALDDPKLIEIVKTAPSNKDGKVHLSWVYKEAERYVHGKTNDLQETKELAVATRFLAMLRRQFPDEFIILAAILEEESNLRDDSKVMDDLGNDLIQLLEKKLGWKIKKCGSCKYMYYSFNNQRG